MAIHYRTEGIVLRKDDYREADELLTFYTRDYGKAEILGKAIRKIGSKLRGAVQLFHFSGIEFIQGKAYKTLTDAVLINNFPGIRKDLRKLKIAYQLAELLDSLIIQEERDEKIWELLQEVFGKLDSPEIRNPEILYYYFFWNLLSFLGYRPQLQYCSVCQKKLVPGSFFFGQKAGGVICPKCIKGDCADSQKINEDVIKILRLFLERNWQTISKLKASVSSWQLLKKISENYLNDIIK